MSAATRPSTHHSNAAAADPGRRLRRRARGVLAALFAAICVVVVPVAPAFGEGSFDFNTGPDTANRQGLEMYGLPTLTGEPLYTVLYVYARAGETINMGSSATTGQSNILVYAPGTDLERKNLPQDPVFATDIFDCDTNAPGTGAIPDGAAGRDQEAAGPLPNAGGYVPCTFTPTADGIYPVIMMPPNPDPPGVSTDNGTVAVPDQQADATIAVWDITVRDGGGATQPGRTFSYAYSSGVLTTNASGVETFVYTPTGYEYQVNFYNQGGAHWTLTSDDLGVVDAVSKDRLMASFDCDRDNNNACDDVRAELAPPERRFPLFLNRPAAAAISGDGGLAETRGYATSAITPASNPLGLAFAGSAGADATNRTSGGTVTFTSPSQMAGRGYTLAIDIDRNGVFGDGSDVVDAGELEADGTRTFNWNGLNAAGAVPACGDYQYQVRSSLSEVHFTMNDVENSGGTRIERLTLPFDPALGNPLAISYRDIDPFTGTAVTNTSPLDSTGNGGPGFHAWTNGSGSGAYVDTWSKLPDVQTTRTLRLLCADPKVVKSASPTPVVPGEQMTFRLDISNAGPDAATNVVVKDNLPDSVTFRSASDGCVEAAGTVTCTAASVPTGGTRTFEIVVDVDSSVTTCIENVATLTNSTFDTDLQNNEDEICPTIARRSDLAITKTASHTQVGPDGQVMFTLVVENLGPSDSDGAEVRDPLVPGLTLVAADPSQGTCSTANNILNCDLGGLKVGGSAQVLVTAQLSGTQCVTNTARVRGANVDPVPANNQDGIEVCPAPDPEPRFDLIVTKTVNDRTLLVGQTARYRVVVRNNGPDAAPNAKVTDTLNAPVDVVAVETPQGSCTKSIPMRCALGRMEAGASVTITIRVKHREVGCNQRNAASATGDGTDTNPANNMDTVDVCVRKIPRLRISKTASRSVVQGGETFSYRIRVRNPSKGEPSPVKVCDRLPSGLRYVSSKPRARTTGRRQCWTIPLLKAGKSRTFRVTVRAASGASGRKTNTATAGSPDVTRRVRARARVRINPLPDRPTG